MFSNKLIYYVYAYLRSKDSTTAKAGTPYYIGKGKGNRAYAKHRIMPDDKSLIVFLETELTETGAFAVERRMICWYGRKDLGTGILRNLTDGGEGTSGIKITEETRKRLSLARKGKSLKPCSDAHKYKISNANKGRKRSTTTRLQMSESHKGLVVWNAGIKTGPDPIVTCPHCNNTGGKRSMGRWHFDHCRSRTS